MQNALDLLEEEYSRLSSKFPAVSRKALAWAEQEAARVALEGFQRSLVSAGSEKMISSPERQQNSRPHSRKWRGKPLVHPTPGDTSPTPTQTLGEGWMLRTGRGKFVWSQQEEGTVRVEGLTTGFFLCTYDCGPERSSIATDASYDIKVNLRIVRVDTTDPQYAYIILALGRTGNGITGTTGNFICVSVDTFNKVYRVERVLEGAVQQVYAERVDRTLQPNVFIPLEVQVRGNRLTLVVRDQLVFESVQVPPTDIDLLRGPVGLAVYKSRVDFKNWTVTSRSASDSFFPALNRSPYMGDDRKLVRVIEHDILERSLGVTFEQIAGLEDAKRLLNEAVVLPLIIPEFFTGIREPWKGVLLYGPPGTGKTLLARAVASMGHVTFFNCSAASIISKWLGESEKLVRTLFNMARHYSPSIVFFDEFDSLMNARGGPTEHEASRRMKSEILQQMDGILSGASGQSTFKSVMVLTATNVPWDLDDAMRRRLEKRIYIAPPDQHTRKAMFDMHLKTLTLDPDVLTEELASMTENYSGSDVYALCRDASLMPMRRLVADKSPDEIRKMKEQGFLDKCTITKADFLKAIENTRPSLIPATIKRYVQWQGDFGAQ